MKTAKLEDTAGGIQVSKVYIYPLAPTSEPAAAIRRSRVNTAGARR